MAWRGRAGSRLKEGFEGVTRGAGKKWDGEELKSFVKKKACGKGRYG